MMLKIEVMILCQHQNIYFLATIRLLLRYLRLLKILNNFFISYDSVNIKNTYIHPYPCIIYALKYAANIRYLSRLLKV